MAIAVSAQKVLVVDDEDHILELARLYLSREGYQIETVTDGAQALARFGQVRPDLVVLDIMLPDINGKEVCQRVRADDTLEQVKIICISGMVEQDKVADLRAAGADDFMQKPFTVDKLVDRACELLDMEKAVLA